MVARTGVREDVERKGRREMKETEEGKGKGEEINGKRKGGVV